MREDLTDFENFVMMLAKANAQYKIVHIYDYCQVDVFTGNFYTHFALFEFTPEGTLKRVEVV